MRRHQAATWPDKLFKPPPPTIFQGTVPPRPGLPPGSAGRRGCGHCHRDPGRSRPPSRRGWRRRATRTLALLTAVLLAALFGTFFWAESRLHREVDLAKIADRAPLGKGTNYLIVGSDSRAGLSDKAKKDLHTGGEADAGRRTDSMILLHTGAHGTTMMSLPRDSWVTIPPYIRPDTGVHYPASQNKLNAAFAFGGPELLIRTIERNTGLHVDHYTEVGFAGFVGIVNAVGGVQMCLDKDVRDEKSGADLTRGCHTLNGRMALAFVRERHQETQGDLGRTENQQKFLSALARKAAAPGVVLNPAKLYETTNAGLGALIVDKNMRLWDLAAMFRAMNGITAGQGKRFNIPVTGRSFPTHAGSAVKWNAVQTQKLFTELRNDRPVSYEGGS
ncbi:LCP family protein [Streptomyces sp. NPDC020801]|uniref:LCP family protein n=1 Tax=unclassified Streptomyces TaxID=2593676 RepID=UPI0037AF6526